MLAITGGLIEAAQKIVLYGPEGIGKSTFASQFPTPVFIDTEGSTVRLDVKRFPKPSSWQMLLQEVQQVRDCPAQYRTLVLDTADWAEQLCAAHICAQYKKGGIEDFGYGKGYVYVMEEFGRLLNLLQEVVDACHVNVLLTAHAKMRKFEQPDEMGSYDRWEMKLSKNVAPLLKEWADAVLFANYKTFAVATGEQGNKFKAQGGKRVMYTAHHPCWDAKNRYGLKDEDAFDAAVVLPFLWGGDASGSAPATVAPPPASVPASAPAVQPVSMSPPISAPPAQTKLTPRAIENAPSLSLPAPPSDDGFTVVTGPTPFDAPPLNEDLSSLPSALADLMRANNVPRAELQAAVAHKGYYPVQTPIEVYDPDFVQGVLVGAWSAVLEIVCQQRGDLPF